MAGARFGAELRLDERTKLVAYLSGATPFTPLRLLVANEAVWTTGPANFSIALGGEWSP
jgi:hypothetical protein